MNNLHRNQKKLIRYVNSTQIDKDRYGQSVIIYSYSIKKPIKCFFHHFGTIQALPANRAFTSHAECSILVFSPFLQGISLEFRFQMTFWRRCKLSILKKNLFTLLSQNSASRRFILIALNCLALRVYSKDHKKWLKSQPKPFTWDKTKNKINWKSGKKKKTKPKKNNRKIKTTKEFLFSRNKTVSDIFYFLFILLKSL